VEFIELYCDMLTIVQLMNHLEYKQFFKNFLPFFLGASTQFKTWFSGVVYDTLVFDPCRFMGITLKMLVPRWTDLPMKHWLRKPLK